MKSTCRFFAAIFAIAFCSLSVHGQIRQTKLYIDDNTGKFSILQAAPGGGTVTMPAGSGTLSFSGGSIPSGAVVGFTNDSARTGFTDLAFSQTFVDNGLSTGASNGAGISGQVLTSNGTAAPNWQYTVPRGAVVAFTNDSARAGFTDLALSQTFVDNALSTGALSATSITLTNPLAVNYGGTGTATAPTTGGVIYGASATAYASTAAGTSGQVRTSNGAAAPSWQYTVPSGAVVAFPSDNAPAGFTDYGFSQTFGTNTWSTGAVLPVAQVDMTS